MKKTACLLTILLLLFSAAACGKQETSASSQPSSVPAAVSSEVFSQAVSADAVYTWGKVQVGMSYDAVVAALGNNTPQTAEGRTYLCYIYENIHALKEGSEAEVVFVFNAAKQLEEIQYIVKEEHGVSYDETVAYLTKLYGVPTVPDSADKTTVWKFQNGYLDVTEMSEGDGLYCVTFYAAAYYEREFPEVANACQK